MSTETVPVRSQQPETLKSLLSKPATIDRLAAIAPKYLSPDRLIRILLLTVSRDQKLMRCTPQSLLAALMKIAQFGLEPDGRLVHLVPYKDQVNVIVDWKGLIEIARRNGIEANATLVYQEDGFELMPDDGTGRCFLKHTVDTRQERTKIIGAYSRSRRADGTGQIDYEWMSLSEIETVRKRSQAANAGPWVTDFGEMCRKTVLRRHSKRWPLCAEDRAATEDDDAPTEILARRADVSSEQARPVFKSIKEADDDDLPYDESMSPAVEVEPAIQTQAPAPPEPPPAQRPRKGKVEAPPPVVKPPEPPRGETLADKLQAWVEVDMGSDFNIFQRAVVELNWVESAPTWQRYADVPDEAAAKLLNAHKTVGRAIEMVKAGEA